MAIAFTIATLALLVLLMALKKEEKKQNFTVWLICNSFFVLCVQVFLGGITGLLGLRISLLPVFLAELLLCGGCAYWIKRNGIQKYYVSVIDLIGVAVLNFAIYKLAVYRFGTDFSTIDFLSVDAGVHAKYAKDIAIGGTIHNSKYFAAIIAGFTMNIEQGLTGDNGFVLQRGYIIIETVLSVYSCLLLWAVLRERVEKGAIKLLIPPAIALIYWIGYPAYSTLYGFSWFSAGICVLTFLLFWMYHYQKGSVNRLYVLIALNAALYGIFVSYTLFVPVAFVGCFSAIAIGMWQKDGKKMVSRENILTMLKIFLVPSVFGMLYSYPDLQEVPVIAQDGGCYSDLYSNFILLIPFAALGCYFLIRRKESKYILPMLTVQLLFMAFLLIKAIGGQVSAYYYMKNNSFLAMMIWILVGEALIHMTTKNRAAALFLLYFYGLVVMKLWGDKWIQKQNPRLITVSADGVFNIVGVNKMWSEMTDQTEISAGKMELCQYAAKNFSGKELAVIGTEIDNMWFKFFTDNDILFTYGNQTDFEGMLNEETKYVCAFSSDAYEKCRGFIDRNEVVFKNEAGLIVQLESGE